MDIFIITEILYKKKEMLHPRVYSSEKRILSYIENLWIYCKPNSIETILLAFVHKSFSADFKDEFEHNERLEFLWDGLLWAIINILLYQKFCDLAESELTLYKIALVREENLVNVARKIKLWGEVFISNGEENMNWREKDSILSDSLEALIGAIFLEFWWSETVNFVEKYVYSEMVSIQKRPSKSYKSLVQEIVQKLNKTLPEYRDSEFKISKSGSVVTYKSEIFILGEKKSEWFGHSKKKAQEDSAKKFYETLNID